MATPSVLTVPSMYGDGILYSGPTVFGPVNKLLMATLRQMEQIGLKVRVGLYSGGTANASATSKVHFKNHLQL